MKTLHNLSVNFLGILIILIMAGFSNESETDSALSKEMYTFTLSGTVTNGHPDISWNPVPGADEYVVTRTPIPATGYSGGSFNVSTNGFIDTGVGAAEQSGGFCQIRYTVSAYDNEESLIATSNPIEFITTPNDVVIQTGECYDPI